MRIEGKRMAKPLAEIEVGECFMYREELYMKADESAWSICSINCVSVQYGSIHRIDDECMVTPVNAKAVVE